MYNLLAVSLEQENLYRYPFTFVILVALIGWKLTFVASAFFVQNGTSRRIWMHILHISLLRVLKGKRKLVMITLLIGGIRRRIVFILGRIIGRMRRTLKMDKSPLTLKKVMRQFVSRARNLAKEAIKLLLHGHLKSRTKHVLISRRNRRKSYLRK